MPWIKCLGGGGGKARRGKPLSVSQPIHLLVKSDFEPQCHVFRTKQLRKPRPCHLCHQAVIKQASCCRVCKYICHKTCEDKFKATRDAVWISRTSENLRGACGELHHNAEEEKEKRSMRQQQSREEMSREPCRWAM